MPKKTDKPIYEQLRERAEPAIKLFLEKWQETPLDSELAACALCEATVYATVKNPEVGGLIIAFLLLEKLEREEQDKHNSIERDLQE